MTDKKFTYEHRDRLDPEVKSLVRALNSLPGIYTVESCCGHGQHPFRIWFRAESLDALCGLAWFLGAETVNSLNLHRWYIWVTTEKDAGEAHFCLQGPNSAYEDAERLAELIMGGRDD